MVFWQSLSEGYSFWPQTLGGTLALTLAPVQIHAEDRSMLLQLCKRAKSHLHAAGYGRYMPYADSESRFHQLNML